MLAEEGIDVDNIDVPDLATLQAALNWASERRGQLRFNPVGPARDVTLTTLQLVVEAIAEDDTHLAGTVVETVQPEPRMRRPSPLPRASASPCHCSMSG